MIKLEIVNELNGRRFGAKFQSKAEADAWVQSCVSKSSWGKPERVILEEDISEELRARILSTDIQEAVEAVAYQPAIAPIPAVPEHWTNGEQVVYLAEEIPLIDEQPDPAFIHIPAKEAVAGQEEVQAVEAQEEVIRHTVKADYVITETDLSLDVNFRNSQQIEKRKQEYPALEQILHIILDHGLESQEMIDLQALRQIVKEKYPLE